MLATKPMNVRSKFWIGDKALFVESVEDQWRGNDALYFRINADDGNSYIVRSPKAQTYGRWRNLPSAIPGVHD